MEEKGVMGYIMELKYMDWLTKREGGLMMDDIAVSLLLSGKTYSNDTFSYNFRKTINDKLVVWGLAS